MVGGEATLHSDFTNTHKSHATTSPHQARVFQQSNVSLFLMDILPSRWHAK